MPRHIIVSDLHVETWTDEPYGNGLRRKPKPGHWCEFLDWCEQKQIDRLIINGDLMDAPPYDGDVSFTSAIARQAVERLLKYAAKRAVTYIYGNHDIGISGLRCAGGSGLAALERVNLYYPGSVLETDGSTLLIQHGYLYDPALILYLKDLDVRTYLVSHFQAFEWVEQRRNPNTGKQVQPAGVASPATIGLADEPQRNIYYGVQRTEKLAPPSLQDLNAARDFIQGLKHGVVAAVGMSVKHVIWREAARSVFGDYLSQGTAERPVIYCIMGHTHVPDSQDWAIQGKQCIYLNSGTWVGSGDDLEDRQHATYLDVREDGKVWMQDWIRNPYLDEPGQQRPASQVAAVPH
jgi:UDP-2,3-diacylglucosamine pyrophosphatase LpxH